MLIDLTQRYGRDVKKIPVHIKKAYMIEEGLIFDSIRNGDEIGMISNCKKIVGYDGSYYRIKILKDYRIGIQVVGD